jgi:hypothetical protein
MVITLTRSDPPLRMPIVLNEDGREILVQTDYDYPGIAESFGWSVSSVEEGKPHSFSLPCEHRETDGTIECPACGEPASSFITAARDWLDEHEGATADDPGYFTEGEPWFPPEPSSVAIKDANGVDLGYAGPDGTTLYYRGYPVGDVHHWERIFRLLIEARR